MRLGVVVLALLWSSGPVQAQQPADSAADVVRTVRVTGAPVVRVVLGRGDVLVRPAQGGVVHVRTRALSTEGAGSDAQQLVTIGEADGLIEIAATAAGSSIGVALILDVPPDSELEVSLERGDIRTESVAGTVALTTARGDVSLLDHAGSAVVDVRNGNVHASFRMLDGSLPSAFTTLNGNVGVLLPSNAAAALDVRCRGCTLRDVPPGGALQVTRILAPPDGDPVLAMHGPLGGGGAALRVFTWNGEVSLRFRP